MTGFIVTRDSRSFNTASGMDCMQYLNITCNSFQGCVSIPQAVWIACNLKMKKNFAEIEVFQYRKRYGLHAILRICESCHFQSRFNTASGMDCMQLQCWPCPNKYFWFQYRKRYGLHAMTMIFPSCLMQAKFQYRKRYGLHAIYRLSVGCFGGS